jgi:hypothetical protein
MLCALATLVAVPVFLASGAGSDDIEIAAVAVPSTESEIQVDGEIEIDGLFSAGARLDDMPVVPEAEPDPQAAAFVLVEAGDVSTSGFDPDVIAAAPQSALVDDGSAEPVAASPQNSTGDTSTETTAPPTTAPPTTAAPTTAPPETAPPETAPPETAPPETAPAETAPADAEATGEPTAEQWAQLRQCEASGDYSVVSSNGLYHGAYQFYQPTWDGLARIAGRSDLVGVPPSQASAGDQDALALLLWQRRGSTPWPHCGRHLPSGP